MADQGKYHNGPLRVSIFYIRSVPFLALGEYRSDLAPGRKLVEPIKFFTKG